MRWSCLNCGAVDALSIHGRCATCNSDAVAPGEGIRPVVIPTALERWFRQTIESAKEESNGSTRQQDRTHSRVLPQR